jgi:transposase
LDDGLSKTAIAARLGVSRRVVHYWIKTGQLDRDLDAPPRRAPRPRATKLDRYTPIIAERLASYPELSAVRLYDEVRASGYTGSVTQLRAYVARVRPRPEPEPVLRFETPAGHQAQVDFAEVRFPWGKRYAVLVVLGYSRLLWLKFYPRQTLETVMHGLEEAFVYFGGVPRELLFDQMKAVVVEDRRAEGGKLLENPEFLRFARHWSFRIRACRPYRAKTKGKIERPIRYLRSNFLYGRAFVGDADLEDQRARWLDDVANVRIHRTIAEAPRVRFERDERHVLMPLADRAYRPLVLPIERTARRSVVRAALPAAAAIIVEERGLGAYQSLLMDTAVGAAAPEPGYVEVG